MVCAHCGDRLVLDGALGYKHQDGSMYGENGHAVLPITMAAWAARLRRE